MPLGNVPFAIPLLIACWSPFCTAVAVCCGVSGVLDPGGVNVKLVPPVAPPTVAPISDPEVTVTTVVPPPGSVIVCWMLETTKLVAPVMGLTTEVRLIVNPLGPKISGVRHRFRPSIRRD